MNIQAMYLYQHNGTEFSQANVMKADLVLGTSYDVTNIIMGQSNTSVYLAGYDQPFNAIHFEFFEDDQQIDIFKDRRFNPYL